MKKILSLFFSFFLLFPIAACSREKTLTETAAIQKQLAEMQGYACTATLTRFSGQGAQVYETKQYYKADGKYRLELTAPARVAGNYTVFDGERICQYNAKLDNGVLRAAPKSQHRSELFLGQFIANYMQSEGVGVEAAALDETTCIVLEAVIPGTDAAIATEKLWVDRKTRLPLRFVLYDRAENPRYQLDYTAFTFDPPFDEALFTIKE